MRYVFLFLVAVIWSSEASAAGVSRDAPKPLTAETSPAPSQSQTQTTTTKNGKEKKNPDGFPQDLTDARKKNRDDYMAWMKADDLVQKECEAARTAADRVLCERKKAVSQQKKDVVIAQSVETQRKIDTWRRVRVGLPPPDWWPQPAQKNGQTDATSAGGTAPKKDNSVLLPGYTTIMPANTY